jgi:pimeloyl-ACP methyl ester carboxylesterase/ketosteroid isomerase-like protein
MKKLLVLAMLFVTPLFADPVEDVRQAEISFARAFAERKADAFFAHVLDDATFMGAANTLPGKKAVVERWSRFFQSPDAPFSWGPDRVVVNAAGTVGLSAGPVYDPEGRHIGNFSSIWLKQQDGTWKVLFDGPGSQPASFAADAITVEEGFVTADDGTRLHYRKAGRSPVTLIVPLEYALFDDFRQLADVATVISYDPRGRGRSDRPKDITSATIQQDVRDLEAVRKHFKAEKIIPVGYSYLGLAVAMYALEYPDRVARLIQLGPAPMRADTKYPQTLTHGMSDMGASAADAKKWQEDRAAGAVTTSPREYCETQWKVLRYMLVGDPKHAGRLTTGCEFENEWPANFERQYAVTRESINKLTITAADFRKVSAPTLVIHGRKDRNAPYGSGREWAMTLPNAVLVTVPGGAHAAWVDDPVTVFGSIRAFLRRDQPLGAERVSVLSPES